MKSIILEVLPVATLVAAEAFLAAFTTAWAAISILGKADLATSSGIGLGAITVPIAAWLVFQLAIRRRTSVN